MSYSLRPPWTVARQAPLSMGFSRQEYWVGCHALLQGIFLTQGLNPGFPNCRQIPYCLSHQVSPCGTELGIKCEQRIAGEKRRTK